MLVNVAAIGWLTARFSERTIVTRCVATVGVTFLLSAFAAVSLQALLVYLMPMTIAGAVAATILTSCLTKSSSLADAGSIIGFDMAVGTAARVIAPTLAGWLLSFSGQLVGVFCAAFAMLAFSIAASSQNWAPLKAKSDGNAAAAAAEEGEEEELPPLTSSPGSKKDL